WTEELGFDSVWLTEHHFIDYGLSVDPATLACAVASRTERIRIGLAAAILPFHEPLRLAEQMALVDIISKGRLDMGVGRGNRPAEFRGYRVPQHENRAIYVAALAKAGRTDAEKRWLLDRWGVSRHIYVADTDARALEDTQDAEMWYQESLRKFQIPERIEDAHPSLQPGFRAQAERLAKVNWNDLVRETVAFGSPDTVARHIETMRAMGIGQVLCWMNFGGLPQEKIRRSMELFARE